MQKLAKTVNVNVFVPWDAAGRGGPGGQVSKTGKLFPQDFGDLVVPLLLFLAPNLVIRRLKEGTGTACTPLINLGEGDWWPFAGSSLPLT